MKKLKVQNSKFKILIICLSLCTFNFILLIREAHAQTIRSNPVTILFGNATPPPTSEQSKIANDGKHACPLIGTHTTHKGDQSTSQGSYSYVCGHCTPIFNANDVVVGPQGRTPVAAVVDGEVKDNSNPVGGPALFMIGDDKQTYYYAHLKPQGLVTGRVRAGQVIGYIASANDGGAKNNGVAHVHFSASTTMSHTFTDPPNLPVGRLLDAWCGNNVCNGRANEAYKCGG